MKNVPMKHTSILVPQTMWDDIVYFSGYKKILPTEYIRTAILRQIEADKEAKRKER